jgi:dCTP deaminase
VTLLSDGDILALIKSGELVIEPFDIEALGPCSVDLRLGPELLKYSAQSIELGHTVPETESIKIGEDGYLLGPGEFVLGMTSERIGIPNGYHGIIETKGDLARAGVQVHANDAHIDAGTDGHITLELKSLHHSDVSIRLFQDIYICQIFFVPLSNPAQRLYAGKYAHQHGPTKYLPR